ncbi:MAG: copper oxidase [Verrucomicrobiota bacterium]
MMTRRKFVAGAATMAGGATVLNLDAQVKTRDSDKPRESAAPRKGERFEEQKPMPPGEPGKDYTPVITPNGGTLPWRIVDGVKVYHLIAEPVNEHAFAPGLVANCWGYNGSVHGPTIEAVEGDRVRIYVTNKLPAGTSVHWHGILLPNGMDGVAGLNQKIIQPGETFKYEFTLRQHGTHMYHPHHDEMTQMALGMMGLFIIHPRHPNRRPDRDFALLLSEWKIEVGAARPDPNEMTDFNLFTFNAKVFPGTAPLVAKRGDRVRIRLCNLSGMSHHPIHLHGYQFRITETDGGQIAESAQQLETTALTAVGQTRTFDFVADEPGDWALHCHMTHHVMNQMGHEFENLIGINTEGLNQKIRKLIPGYMVMGQDGMAEMGEMGMKNPRNSIPMMGAPGPFDYITMGGMFTVLKVREGITDYGDPGWYEHPSGTVAALASPEELKRDGIEIESVKQAARDQKSNDLWCSTPVPQMPQMAATKTSARIKVH